MKKLHRHLLIACTTVLLIPTAWAQTTWGDIQPSVPAPQPTPYYTSSGGKPVFRAVAPQNNVPTETKINPHYANSQYGPHNPAPVPGTETGCSAFPRGSQEELNCEVDGYKNSSMLRLFQNFVKTNRNSVQCGRFTAQYQNVGDHAEITVSDNFNSFVLGYRDNMILIPNDVESTVLWQTRDRVLKMLYACRDAGMDTGLGGYLPPVTNRVRTQGEYNPTRYR
ncbi:MAG: hypothetical protein JNN12_03275 [Bacteroidetes Order II. Incertae sedis bacterium]|nr:hypothetical protein [Bacteroidetes Order II. bacterium]